ncbi:hypothetical protein [Lysinibacillus sp. NPDC092081]|uniref:hypothetical protein n=1 Tax=Lysinibacillus sp. NPDC092081 TaxID=3364131 RepID=UPI00381A943D
MFFVMCCYKKEGALKILMQFHQVTIAQYEVPLYFFQNMMKISNVMLLKDGGDIAY